MVLFEVMYYGLAVLTTENGESDMLIKSEENGCALPLNVKIWADRIVQVSQEKKMKKAFRRVRETT